MPHRPEDAYVDAYRAATDQLVAAAKAGRSHGLDIVFGTRVVELIADAQSQLDA
jgi:hypothetical protein